MADHEIEAKFAVSAEALAGRKQQTPGLLYLVKEVADVIREAQQAPCEDDAERLALCILTALEVVAARQAEQMRKRMQALQRTAN